MSGTLTSKAASRPCCQTYKIQKETTALHCGFRSRALGLADYAAAGIGEPSGKCVGRLRRTLSRTCISSYQRLT